MAGGNDTIGPSAYQLNAPGTRIVTDMDDSSDSGHDSPAHDHAAHHDPAHDHPADPYHHYPGGGGSPGTGGGEYRRGGSRSGCGCSALAVTALIVILIIVISASAARTGGNPGPVPSGPVSTPALLPDSFNAGGEQFTMRSAGPEPCINQYENATARSILTQYNCVSQMTGSYVNDSGTILVSVEVMPLADEDTAQQVYSAVKQAGADGDIYSGNLGFWCPTSGIGAVCDSSYFSAATDEGEFTFDEQYFLNADAVWISLSGDTSSSAEDPLQAAADAAVLAAGPGNY
jgi:hypothetical protein